MQINRIASHRIENDEDVLPVTAFAATVAELVRNARGRESDWVAMCPLPRPPTTVRP
ncbi:hypothetical protein PISMIDRAFT_675758 [Pisolithus microcarpus 441]|uniref:Uncharacterized protein n=1 Tax=Pisolithus microcarpus 441 TaxID=765257 RepID=A0A0C9YP02_9AGAM|nr:hypothetical protein PISMIDRAFT_675758 [Pisolithus microcarpus 441]